MPAAMRKKGEDNDPLKVLWTCLVLAVIFSAVGFYHYRRTSTLANNGVRTEGRVVDTGTRTGSKGRRYRTVTVRFSDGSGQTRTFRVDNDDLDPGDRAPVIYVADDPKVADLADSSRASVATSWIFIGLAVVFWGGFGWQIRQMGKRPKRLPPK